ncbi:MAG: hypothetical protein AUK63_1061 [bacterium P3]|nr:MAG: hypothetical protein AUK63_1061 [bacterium P3]KWW40754.1 MAG: hypothetical protein F083_1409 [bacterium F083]
MKRYLYLPLVLATLLLAGCGGHDFTPKPAAYLRIDLPEKHYAVYDTTALPFRFECAGDCEVVWKRDNRGEKWIDLYYPKLRGVVYLSYKAIDGVDAMRAQIDTAYKFLSMHFDHSSGIDERQYVDPVHHVYATTNRLTGTHVASTCQFWATDSSSHFLRGSLYLDYTPNNDSLAPVIAYLQSDIDRLIETLQWK